MPEFYSPAVHQVVPDGRYGAVSTEHGLVVVDARSGQYVLIQAQQPVPAPAAVAAPGPAGRGLAAAERRLVVYTLCGATLLLAGGGTVLMVGHGVAAARPGLHELAHVLEWAALLVAVAVVGVAVLVGRRAAGRRTVVTERHHYHTQARGMFARASTHVRE